MSLCSALSALKGEQNEDLELAICNTLGVRSRRVNRTRVSLSTQTQAQDDPIKLRRVRVGGDDPLIGDIHVSNAESTERRLTKRHESICAGDTKVERRRAHSQDDFDEVRT